jgi:hypothetical protein
MEIDQLDEIALADSTSELTGLLEAFCKREAIPHESADLLLLRVLDWKHWLQSFCDKWEMIQESEDNGR